MPSNLHDYEIAKSRAIGLALCGHDFLRCDPSSRRAVSIVLSYSFTIWLAILYPVNSKYTVHAHNIWKSFAFEIVDAACGQNAFSSDIVAIVESDKVAGHWAILLGTLTLHFIHSISLLPFTVVTTNPSADYSAIDVLALSTASLKIVSSLFDDQKPPRRMIAVQLLLFSRKKYYAPQTRARRQGTNYDASKLERPPLRDASDASV